MMVSYDGRLFRSRANSAGGDVGSDTRFHYHQRDRVVWATYEGGTVLFGTLIGTCDEEGRLDLRYQHVTVERTLKTGRCRSAPELLPDGRLLVRETWEWTEGGEGRGTSEIEEIG